MYTLLKSVPYPISSSRTVPFGTFTSAPKRTLFLYANFVCRRNAKKSRRGRCSVHCAGVCVWVSELYPLVTARTSSCWTSETSSHLESASVVQNTHTSRKGARVVVVQVTATMRVSCLYIDLLFFLSSKHWCESADEKRKSTLRVSHVRVHNKMEVAGVAI